jgi:hypothetical protein
MATHREGVAIESDEPDEQGTEQAPAKGRSRLKRGPVEIHLPERDQIPAERLDAAYRILVRLVARQVRQARREAAVNDEHRTGSAEPAGPDGAHPLR